MATNSQTWTRQLRSYLVEKNHRDGAASIRQYREGAALSQEAMGFAKNIQNVDNLKGTLVQGNAT